VPAPAKEVEKEEKVSITVTASIQWMRNTFTASLKTTLLPVAPSRTRTTECLLSDDNSVYNLESVFLDMLDDLLKAANDDITASGLEATLQPHRVEATVTAEGGRAKKQLLVQAYKHRVIRMSEVSGAMRNGKPPFAITLLLRTILEGLPPKPTTIAVSSRLETPVPTPVRGPAALFGDHWTSRSAETQPFGTTPHTAPVIAPTTATRASVPPSGRKTVQNTMIRELQDARESGRLTPKVDSSMYKALSNAWGCTEPGCRQRRNTAYNWCFREDSSTRHLPLSANDLSAWSREISNGNATLTNPPSSLRRKWVDSGVVEGGSGTAVDPRRRQPSSTRSAAHEPVNVVIQNTVNTGSADGAIRQYALPAMPSMMTAPTAMFPTMPPPTFYPAIHQTAQHGYRTSYAPSYSTSYAPSLPMYGPLQHTMSGLPPMPSSMPPPSEIGSAAIRSSSPPEASNIQTEVGDFCKHIIRTFFIGPERKAGREAVARMKTSLSRAQEDLSDLRRKPVEWFLGYGFPYEYIEALKKQVKAFRKAEAEISADDVLTLPEDPES